MELAACCTDGGGTNTAVDAWTSGSMSDPVELPSLSFRPVELFRRDVDALARASCVAVLALPGPTTSRNAATAEAHPMAAWVVRSDDGRKPDPAARLGSLVTLSTTHFVAATRLHASCWDAEDLTARLHTTARAGTGRVGIGMEVVGGGGCDGMMVSPAPTLARHTSSYSRLCTPLDTAACATLNC